MEELLYSLDIQLQKNPFTKSALLEYFEI